MTPGGPIAPTDQDLDDIAWNFLESNFTGKNYVNWSIERRVDAYLLDLGMTNIVNDGSLYNALLERVMANIGRARRMGILPGARQ
jgi:hypothetical protein